MTLLEICHWMQHLEWSQALLQSTWVFPIIEGTHIMALSISVGMVMILDLRLLRLGFRGERVSVIMKQSAGLSLLGFGIMFATGLILFVTQAEKAYKNPFFVVKLAMLAAAGINALWYQKVYYPKMDEWDLAEKVPAGPRACAFISIVAWFIVIACGRTMAYEF